MTACGRSVALVITDPRDQDTLGMFYERAGWTPRLARTVWDGAALLAANEIDLVVCDYRLCDGSWRDILAITGTHPGACPVVVASRLADEHMWAEVLNLGGFDVVAMPYDADEVLRVSASACRSAVRKPALPATEPVAA